MRKLVPRQNTYSSDAGAWKLKYNKGATPASGKWNNTYLKVMIQWFKRDGDKAMPKNKEGLLLRYRETHTRVVDNTLT
jgi:hypothetical protein